jgi:hypothetical protein
MMILASFLAIVSSRFVNAQILSAPKAGYFKFSIDSGASYDGGGNFLTKTNGTMLATPVKFDDVKFRDVYNNATFFSSEVSYAPSALEEYFFRLTHLEADANSTTIGTLSSAPFLATFDDYSETSFALGARQYIPIENTLFTPYFGVVLGIKTVDDIGAHFTIPAAGIDEGRQPFYKQSTVPTAGLEFGFLYPLSSMFAIGLQSGIYYQGGLQEDDTYLLTAPRINDIADANDDSDRLSIPVSFKMVVKY